MSTITAPPRPWQTGPIVGRSHTGPSWDGRVRWTARGRLVVTAAVTLVLGWGVIGGIATTSEAAVTAQPPLTVVIQAGDTVWDLASAHAPAGVSTQEYMMVIVHHNDVRATELRPGSVLELPR